jgi:single-strand DNA-binding protein
MNRVTLIGHVGSDPEVTYTEGGSGRMRFNLATNIEYQDKEGNYKTLTDWHKITCFRLHILSQYPRMGLKKGAKVFVDGRIRYNSWRDKGGVNRTETQIVADIIEVIQKI